MPTEEVCCREMVRTPRADAAVRGKKGERKGAHEEHRSQRRRKLNSKSRRKSLTSAFLSNAI